MGRSSAALLLLLVACVVPGAAQDTTHAATADTGARRRIIMIDPGLSTGHPVFLFPPSMEVGKFLPDRRLELPEDDFTAWRPFTAGMLDRRADLMSPLRLQMERQKKWDTVFMVLGAVELGAVGYMAYEHIRKYGLFR